MGMTLFFLSSLLFLEERAHTHTRPPERAKPSWERSNSGGLSPPVPSRTLPGQREHVAHIVCRKHSPLQDPLVPSFFLLLSFFFPPIPSPSQRRERANFIRQDSPPVVVRLICRDILSLARSLSAGFLIIHRLSLSLTQSPNCTLDYLFCCSLTVLDAALPINNLLTTIDSSLGVVSLAKKRETSFLMMNDQRTN